jgi:hypothetical protein
MPNNKNQHYIPKFYLRNFSLNHNGKTVHLYNISRDLVIPSVGISGQCYRHYLYGKDGRLERGLGMLEAATSPLLGRMIMDGKLPPRRSPEHGLLGQFISIQHQRTEIRETEINEMADQFVRHILKRKEPELAKHLDRVRISVPNAAILNVHNAAVRAPLLFDLEYKLLTTPRDRYFITSDNPVVLLNQLMGLSALYAHGFASRGLQIYFPLSPNCALFFYDHDLYKAGPVGRHRMEITPSDVSQLNALQFIYAYQNIYFSFEKQATEVRNLAKRYNKFRRSQVGGFKVISKEADGENIRDVALVGTLRARFSPELHFTRFKRRVDKTPTPGSRDPALVTIVQDFAKALQKGGAREFGTFVMKHPLAWRVRAI